MILTLEVKFVVFYWGGVCFKSPLSRCVAYRFLFLFVFTPNTPNTPNTPPNQRNRSILFDEPVRIPSGESYAFRVEAVCGSFTTGPACDPADAGVLEEFNGGELTLWNVQVDFGGPSPVCVDIDIDIAYSRIAPTAGVQTSPDLSAIVQEFMDDLIPDDLPVHTMVLRIEGGEGLVLEATGGSFYAAAASGIIVIDVRLCVCVCVCVCVCCVCDCLSVIVCL